MARGGKRPGAGRPKKKREVSTDSVLYDSAQAYLEAVVAGTEPADPARIQAAKTLISYQNQKVRVPKESPAPRELHTKEKRNVEAGLLMDFEAKAAVIRAKHKQRIKTDG
ncbi:MAG: hypothetical protein R6W88_08855 [Desulfobacterales bacterium]